MILKIQLFADVSPECNSTLFPENWPSILTIFMGRINAMQIYKLLSGICKAVDSKSGFIFLGGDWLRSKEQQ